MTQAKMPIRKWSAGRGALLFIAFLFATSAAIRIGFGAAPAIAKEFSERQQDLPIPIACQNPTEIENILGVLAARTETLNGRRRTLDERAQTLIVAENQIRINLGALVQAEEKLAATMARSETAAEDDLARLTSVYENMKPKDASVLFETMSPDFAAGFVGRMRPDSAAQIMAGLSPSIAYSISVILAGRNARAPTK